MRGFSLCGPTPEHACNGKPSRQNTNNKTTTNQQTTTKQQALVLLVESEMALFLKYWAKHALCQKVYMKPVATRDSISLVARIFFREDSNNIVISHKEKCLREQRGENNAGLESVCALM